MHWHAYNPLDQAHLDELQSIARKINPRAYLIEAAKDGDIECIKNAITCDVDINTKKMLGSPLLNDPFCYIGVLIFNPDLPTQYYKTPFFAMGMTWGYAAHKIFYERYTALMCASINGHANIVHLLLEQPKIDINAKYKNSTAFDMSIKKGDVKIANLIKNKIEEIKNKMLSLTREKNITHEEQKKEIKKLAMQIHTFDIQDANGNTPLHLAIISENIELAKWLLAIQPALIARKNSLGQNPIELAAGNGYSDFIKQLINHGKLDLDKKETILKQATKRCTKNCSIL